MFEQKTAKYIFFAVVVVALIGYFSGLTVDVTRDAGKYATISKEIYQNGNYINLTVHGDAYDQKPPMLFWMGALGFTIGGISNFWFKLPVLLLVFAGFYWAFRLGQSLYNKRVGWIAAFIMAFSLVYSMYSMDIHTDTPLQAFITLALWQFFEFIKTKKTLHCILGFVAIGLAMLCKGPIGAAIPAFAVLGHIIMKKDYKFLADYRWYLGIIISFLVVSPALIGLWNQFEWEGLRFFFWDNNFGRYNGSYTNTFSDPIFYVHTLLYLLLPWSLLFYIAAFSEFRYLIKNRFKTHEYFTFAGIWIFFIILNTSRSQLPNYVFGIIPLIAVLTAKWIDKAVNEKSKTLTVITFVQTAISFFLWLFILILAFYVFENLPWYNYIFIALGITGTLYIYSSKSVGIDRLLMPSAITFVVLAFVLNTSVFPEMFRLQAPSEAARYFSRHFGENSKLFNYKYDQYELFFYSEPQAEQIHKNEDISKIANKEGNWIFTTKEGLNDLIVLNAKPDTIIQYNHFSMKNAGLYFNPKTRSKMHEQMYLLKY